MVVALLFLFFYWCCGTHDGKVGVFVIWFLSYCFFLFLCVCYCHYCGVGWVIAIEKKSSCELWRIERERKMRERERGRLSRSFTSCFMRKTVSWAVRRLWENSTFWICEPVVSFKASPKRGQAGTALDRTNSGAAPPDHLRSCLAGKCSQEAMPKP